MLPAYSGKHIFEQSRFSWSLKKSKWKSFLSLLLYAPPRWSLKKRRKNVGLEHKGPSLGLARWKKYYRWILIRTCIKHAICKIAFWWHLCSDAFCFLIFTKMCSPLPPDAHFWKTMLSKMPSKMLVLSHFGMHWPFQSPSVGPSSATKNQKKCCSRGGLETCSIWGRFAIIICNSFLLFP